MCQKTAPISSPYFIPFPLCFLLLSQSDCLQAAHFIISYFDFYTFNNLACLAYLSALSH